MNAHASARRPAYLFIGAWQGRGGMYRQTGAAIRALAAAGHDVRVLDATHRPTATPFADTPARVKQQPLPFEGSNLRLYRAWRAALRDLAADRAVLVLAPARLPPAGLLLAVRLAAGRIYALHRALVPGDRWRPDDESLPPTLDLPARARALTALKARLIHRSIAVSERIRDALIRRYGLSPTRVVACANGVDTTRFRPDDAARRRVRQSLGMAVDGLLVGSLGRLDDAKAVDRILWGFKRFARRRAGADRLVVVGDGPAAAGLRGLAEDLELGARVVFAGWAADSAAWHAAFDVEITASRSEGMANTVLEAMACGTPVIVNNLPGIRACVTDGHDGFVAPLTAPADVAGQLDRLAALDAAGRAAMGAAARRTILDRFRRDERLAALLRHLDAPAAAAALPADVDPDRGMADPRPAARADAVRDDSDFAKQRFEPKVGADRSAGRPPADGHATREIQA